ncbi:hypothetical protein DPEC_G00299100 [Dallia pectoralis]|uniref:Uncharacterized protein n=1 Tax=Dallia pectoralis TaxID=75939 RepID=A0ACC2FG44_DALPE|nr:hypothetical protein DPEC_G00299100 [Dallia pectoralis]
MAKDDSSDEASDVDEVPKEQRKQASKYKCPADFVTFTHNACASTLIDNACDDNTELWLVKAPSTFNPDNFSSLTMPLSQLQTMQAPARQAQDGGGVAGQTYTVLGGPLGAVDLRLLTSHSQTSNTMMCGPAFTGLLNIGESFGDGSTNRAPIAIPATPAPTLPQGLRQRFQPFGSKTPVLSAPLEDADTPPETPPIAVPEPRVEKKRKKKEKRLKVGELMEVEGVKQELQALIYSPEEPSEDGAVVQQFLSAYSVHEVGCLSA